jgi:hypothetical protein
MLTFNMQLAREFGKLTDERIDALTEVLTSGTIPDYGAYQKVVGQVQAFKEAKDLMEEALSICEGKRG